MEVKLVAVARLPVLVFAMPSKLMSPEIGVAFATDANDKPGGSVTGNASMSARSAT